MKRLFFLLLVCCTLLPAWALGNEPVGSTTDGIPGDPAELRIANRSIFTFHATLLGETPAARAQRAAMVIDDALRGTDELKVGVDPIMHSHLVLLGGRRAFIVAPRTWGWRAATPAQPPSRPRPFCARSSKSRARRATCISCSRRWATRRWPA